MKYKRGYNYCKRKLIVETTCIAAIGFAIQLFVMYHLKMGGKIFTNSWAAHFLFLWAAFIGLIATFIAIRRFNQLALGYNTKWNETPALRFTLFVGSIVGIELLVFYLITKGQISIVPLVKCISIYVGAISGALFAKFFNSYIPDDMPMQPWQIGLWCYMCLSVITDIGAIILYILSIHGII